MAQSRKTKQQLAVQQRLGRKLREIREASGLTQAMLAERAEIAEKYLSRIENGRQDPAISIVIRLAKALHVSLDLLSGNGKPDPTILNAIHRMTQLSERDKRLALRVVGAILDESLIGSLIN